MIMHQGTDKVQSFIDNLWRIKFYNGERRILYSAFVKILCSGLVTRITADTVCGSLGTTASL